MKNIKLTGLSYFLIFLNWSLSVGQHAPNSEVSTISNDKGANLYNGAFQEKIHLGEVTSGKLSIPIDLSYNGSGVKVNDRASWVGLGWNLSAGGSITRTVNGIPDDALEYYDSQGDYIEHNYGGMFQTQAYYINYNAEGNRPWPDESDVFQINLPGFSSKFILTQSTTYPEIFFFEKNDYKLEYVYSDQPINSIFDPMFSVIWYCNPPSPHPDGPIKDRGYISQFILTDPNGTKYYFDKKEIAINLGSSSVGILEYSDCQDNSYTRSIGSANDCGFDFKNAHVSNWKLSKIETVYDDHIDFLYSDHRSHTQEAVVEQDNLSSQPYCPACTVQVSFSQVLSYDLLEIQGSTSTAKLVHGNAREDLLFSLGGNDHSVSYHPSYFYREMPKSLSEIEFYKGDQIAPNYKFEFDQDYLESDLCGSALLTYAHKRLMLNSLSLINTVALPDYGSTCINAPYYFAYNTTSLPSRLSTQIDFWGYYNGNEGTSRFPTIYVYPFDDAGNEANLSMYELWPRSTFAGDEYIIAGEDRNPNEALCKAGILEEIHYPSGSVKEIDYELNTFKDGSAIRNGAGLRVREIKISDGDADHSNDIIKEFKYLETGTNESSVDLNLSTMSSGRLLDKPRFASFQYDWSNDPTIFTDAVSPLDTIEKYTLRFSYDRTGVKAKNGSPIAYEEVIVDHKGNGFELVQYDIQGFHGNSIAYTPLNSQGPILVPKNNATTNSGVYLDNFPNPMTPNLDWTVGKLKAEYIFDAAFNIKKSSLYDYIDFPITSEVSFSKTTADNFYYGSVDVSTSLNAYYSFYSGKKVISTKRVRLYSDLNPSEFLQVRTDYEYGTNHYNPIASRLHNQDGIKVEKIKYVKDYNVSLNWPNSLPMDEMSEALTAMKFHNINAVIEELKLIDKGAEKPLEGLLTTFKLHNNIPVVSGKMKLVLNNSSSVTYSTSSIQSDVGFHKDPGYYSILHNSMFDDKGNVTEFKERSSSIISQIYNDQSQVVSKAENAKINEIAFENFDDPLGQFHLNNVNISHYYAGKVGWAGELSAQSCGYTNTFDPIDFNKEYAFSAWFSTFYPGSKMIVRLMQNGTQIALIEEPIPAHSGISVEYSFVESSFRISDYTMDNSLPVSVHFNIANGSSGLLLADELRFQPKQAQMKTSTYSKVNGQLIGQGSIRNEFTTFKYNCQDKVALVLNNDKSIVSVTEYHDKQSNIDLNYKKESTPNVSVHSYTEFMGLNELQKYSSITYFDGLERELQRIDIMQSHQNNDRITFQKYNAFGQRDKLYLAFSKVTSNGAFVSNAELLQNLFYGSIVDGQGYSEFVYNSSPLNRIIERGFPGNASSLGSGHTAEMTIRPNTYQEVRRFFNGNSLNHIGAGELFVLEQKDENGALIRNFFDKEQKLIRRDVEDHSTHYIYDDHARLIAIIPPAVFEKMEELNNFQYNSSVNGFSDAIYKYFYDNKNRIVRRKVPGAKFHRIYYNNRDLVVLNVDGEGNKLFTKYDVYNRPIMTGLYYGSSIPLETLPAYELRSSSTTHGYTALSFPQNAFYVYNVLYYDDYDFNYNQSIELDESYIPTSDTNFINLTSSNVLGYLTGNKTRILGTNNWEFQRFYFDERGKVIQKVKVNHSGENDIEYNRYNFNLQLTRSKLLHRSNLASNLFSVSIMKRFEYDRSGRIKRLFHSVNNESEKIIAEYNYDGRDLLTSKKLGLDNTSLNYLQDINFSYNKRGWLTAINDLNQCDELEGLQVGFNSPLNGQRKIPTIKSTNDASDAYKDLFGMKFHYNNLPASLGTVQDQFNGNITAIEWTSGCTVPRQAYTYTYDNKGRLTDAKYGQHVLGAYYFNQDFDVSGVTYDANGNILSLQRNDLSGQIDNLTYLYELNNTLTHIEETADLTEGFIATTPVSKFHYDKNGNLIFSQNKELDIFYNALNLPDTLSFWNHDSIIFTYNASGEKIRKASKASTENSWNITDYFGSIEYHNDMLEAIFHEEGRVVPVASSFKYEYDMKDHLGNLRISFCDLDDDGLIDENDEILARHDFYPFGMKMRNTFGQIGATNENKYQYTGKELVEDLNLNWIDNDFRWYDPSIARWQNIDPLADQFHDNSPYVFNFNNPIYYVDRDGRASDGWVDVEGAMIWDDRVNSQKMAEFIYGKGVTYYETLLTTNLEGQNVFYNKDGIIELSTTVKEGNLAYNSVISLNEALNPVLVMASPLPTDWEVFKDNVSDLIGRMPIVAEQLSELPSRYTQSVDKLQSINFQTNPGENAMHEIGLGLGKRYAGIVNKPRNFYYGIRYEPGKTVVAMLNPLNKIPKLDFSSWGESTNSILKILTLAGRPGKLSDKVKLTEPHRSPGQMFGQGAGANSGTNWTETIEE